MILAYVEHGVVCRFCFLLEVM